jgi:hypothetical protein
MELPYIQDIAGDKTETPVAPFAKAKEKNIIACTRRIYRQDKLMQANIYDYQASDGKALCSEKLCTKHGETKYEYITEKKGRLLKIVISRSNGNQFTESHRKWIKQVTTFSNGYLTSIQYPNAKTMTTFQFSKKSKSIYAKTINEKENEIVQRWEEYDIWNRLVSQKYIRHAKDNPAEIYEFDSYSYIYQDNLSPNNHISHVLGMIHLAGNMHSMRVVYFDYDKHGNWRTKHIYEYAPDSYNKETLKYIEKRVIAYRNEDIQSVIDAYEEAAYLLDLEQYNDSTDCDDLF